MNDDKLKTIAFTGRIFLSGMNEGFDVLAAEEVLKMKIHYPDIRLHCIIAFAGQPDRMDPQDQSRYESILRAAATCIYLPLRYSKECFLKQSDYLLENSSLLIAYYDNVSKGGTHYTVQNAADRNIQVFNLYDRKMGTHSFYRDELLTCWGRSLFTVDGLSYEQAVESIRLLRFRDVYELEDHPLIAYDSFEYLLESSTRVSFKENEGQATIEYLHGDSLPPPLFSNKDNKMSEEREHTLKMLAFRLAEWEMTDVFKMLPAEFKNKDNPEEYAEVYRERYDKYYKGYLEQLSTL